MWNLKRKDTKELTYKTETALQKVGGRQGEGEGQLGSLRWAWTQDFSFQRAVLTWGSRATIYLKRPLASWVYSIKFTLSHPTAISPLKEYSWSQQHSTPLISSLGGHWIPFFPMHSGEALRCVILTHRGGKLALGRHGLLFNHCWSMRLLFSNVNCLGMGAEETRSKISLWDQIAVNHSKAQIFALAYTPAVPTSPKVCETEGEKTTSSILSRKLHFLEKPQWRRAGGSVSPHPSLRCNLTVCSPF